MREPLSPLNLLLLSTPVAPLGSGGGGGVELTLHNLVRVIKSRGHRVDIVAPAGSVSQNATLHQVPGKLEQPAQHQLRKTGIITDNSFKPVKVRAGFKPMETPDSYSQAPDADGSKALANMCRFALDNQNSYDLIISFAYDLLPLQMTHSFRTPLAHFISMSSLPHTIAPEVSLLGDLLPGRLGCYSKAQAKTFPDPDAFTVLGFGLDLSQYDFCENPDGYLVWTGRISPEKGLEDAIEAAILSGHALKVLGRVDDENYFRRLKNSCNCENVEFTGFLSTENMQQIMRKAKALIMTPRWIEAFGIVAVEALACGVPVISYSAGGPAEIIDSGKTGYLVAPNSIRGLVEAIGKAELINRKDCRIKAVKSWALADWGDRMESWFSEIITTGR